MIIRLKGKKEKPKLPAFANKKRIDMFLSHINIWSINGCYGYLTVGKSSTTNHRTRLEDISGNRIKNRMKGYLMKYAYVNLYVPYVCKITATARTVRNYSATI